MKFSYIICTVVMVVVVNVVMVSANQCLVQNATVDDLDCNQFPSAVNKWKLLGLICFTCVALNINIFRAFILICVIVTINHDIITSMAKLYNICV